ncbi:hypothetical protein BGW37DRAFT_429397, partial [Umbelopsis sp. PMI_123]
LNLPLHVVINNVGAMACPFALSKDGYESQLATKYLTILTIVLFPTLEDSQPSRVVNVSSWSHNLIYFQGLDAGKFER